MTTAGHGYFTEWNGTLGRRGTANSMQVLTEVSDPHNHWLELNELYMLVPLLLGSLLLQRIGSEIARVEAHLLP